MRPAPPLPTAIHAGVVLLGVRIASVRAEPGSHIIVLAEGDRSFEVRVRADEPARPAALRRGVYAIDVAADAALSDRARAAIVRLTRLLPG
jgi:hypothetical protein